MGEPAVPRARINVESRRRALVAFPTQCFPAILVIPYRLVLLDEVQIVLPLANL
jgi:hypothetical protein